MIKNSVKKLIITALCAIFVLPFLSVPTGDVKAEELKKVFKGTDCIVSVAQVEGLKSALSTEVKIEISKDGGSPVLVYDGEELNVTGYTADFSASDDEATINFFNVGVHKVTISKKDGSATYEKSFNVGDTLDFIELEYVLDEDKINDYKAKITANANGLEAGTSSFTVPELSSIINTNFPYGNIRKTVHYYAVGDTVSSSNYASKADLKISIKNYGTYRFYVLFDIEKSNMNIDGAKSISVNGLKENADGFYRCSLDGEEVFYNSTSNKYFALNDDGSAGEEISTEGKALTEALVVPVFEFTVASKAPTIKINSTYYENGFVGLEYDLPEIEIYGDVMSEKYELEYRENDSKEFEIIDELNYASPKFTPEKTGEYRVKITVYGVNENVQSTTGVIKVSKAVQSSPFKASFNDWLEVNVLPFILLCVSFVCLVAIILLLVIKPREAEVSVKEEDR